MAPRDWLEAGGLHACIRVFGNRRAKCGKGALKL